MLSIAFGQSKYHVDNLSENVKRGLRQKLRRGEYPGWPPVGYLNDYKDHTIILDNRKHKPVKRIFELHNTNGHTLKDLAKWCEKVELRGKRDKKLSHSTIQGILKNPFYYGVFTFKGKMYEGKHDPIITKQLYDQAQQMLKKRGKSHEKKKHDFLFAGRLMKCECGCSITAELQKGYTYYRCTKKKGICNEKYTRGGLLNYRTKTIPNDLINRYHITLKIER